MAKKNARKLATLDFETDPFMRDRVPKPFTVGFYTDDNYVSFWGDDCADRMMHYIEGLDEEYDIYAHNGGRFDFFFLFDYFDTQSPKIINGRIVRAKLFGRHFLFDSFAIIPIGLAQYKKDEIDYQVMERATRDKHRKAIEDYLHNDCKYLYEMVSNFRELFGKQLTIGSTAIKKLLEITPCEEFNQERDNFYRQFYFGGRVQTFEHGILPGPWKMVDANSMYPAAMMNYNHPLNGQYRVSKKLPDNWDVPFFAIVDLVNRNALPWREPADPETNIRKRYKRCKETNEFIEIEPEKLLYSRKGITFTKERGTFYVCSHELKVALDLGLVDIEKVHEVHVAQEYGSFKEFVQTYYDLRQVAKASKDPLELFYKLVLNSAYGKFAQNPRDYEDYYFNRVDDGLPHAILRQKGYSLKVEYPEFELWARPTFEKNYSFYDVSIAASITSASRATLMTALAAADRPIYCDTDSIICLDFHGDIDDKRLGAWKPDGAAPYAVICGKKLYALADDINVPTEDDPKWESAKIVRGEKSLEIEIDGARKPVKGKPGETPLEKWSAYNTVKLASKGARLSLHNMIDIAKGGELEYKPDAPIFSLTNRGKFFGRTIKNTVDRNTSIGYKNLTSR